MKNLIASAMIVASLFAGAVSASAGDYSIYAPTNSTGVSGAFDIQD